jgi:hypothetical protein
MKEAIPFYGQVWRKDDISFQTEGLRESVVQTHNLFTDNLGGAVNGLVVTTSSDRSTLYVSPGQFYTAGQFSQVNNNGGGEESELFTQQVFVNLPETIPFQGSPTYLLVYAKNISSPVNPNPKLSQNLITSKNINTGQNIPTRSYNYGQIIISNPITKDNVDNINGVPLALVQINYSGTTKLSSAGTVNFIDQSIRRNYTIAGALDIYNNLLVDDGVGKKGVPNSFITNRMLSPASITADKLVTGIITSPIVASWDGKTEYDSLVGSGIANQHLKGQVVTSDKINYQKGLNGFNVRNRVLNSSFETISGTAQVPTKWDVSFELGTNVQLITSSPTVTTVANGIASVPTSFIKYGTMALDMQGGATGPTAKTLGISQRIKFEDNLQNVPLSAYFWAQAQNSIIVGTNYTGLQGTIAFLAGPGVAQSNVFATVTSGSSTWTQYASSSPIVYSGTNPCYEVIISISGTFSNQFYVDGVFLGESNLIPNFDVNPSEYVVIDGIPAAIISGTISHAQISPGNPTEAPAVWNNNIMNIAGGLSAGPGLYGIATDQIQPGAVTNDKITGPIPISKIDTSTVGLVPEGAIILWDRGQGYDPNDPSNYCPEGYTEVTAMAGMFPLGVNRSPGSVIAGAALSSNIGLGGASPALGTDGVVDTHNTSTDGNHAHSVNIGGSDVGGGGTSRAFPGNYPTSANGDHAHSFDTKIPFYTIHFCRKKP